MIDGEELLGLLTTELNKAEDWLRSCREHTSTNWLLAASQSVVDFNKAIALVKGMPNICEDCNKMGFS